MSIVTISGEQVIQISGGFSKYKCFYGSYFFNSLQLYFALISNLMATFILTRFKYILWCAANTSHRVICLWISALCIYAPLFRFAELKSLGERSGNLWVGKNQIFPWKCLFIRCIDLNLVGADIPRNAQSFVWSINSVK